MYRTTRVIIVAILCVISCGLARAQGAESCSSEEARQLDFWLGEWERSFDGGVSWEMVWVIHYERR